MHGLLTEVLQKSYSNFLFELKNEYAYFQEGGSNYRKITAKLSLELVVQVNDIAPFLEKCKARETVYKYYPNLDFYRKEDVAKFLNVIAVEVHHGSTTFSDDVKNYVQKKRHSQKPALVIA